MNNQELLGFERLVVSQALSFVTTREFNELVQIGWLGLLKARKNYDPNVGKFEPYAKNCIINELKKSENQEYADLGQEYYIEKEKIDWYIPDFIMGDDRVLIQMKIEGYSYNEIADLLNIDKTMAQLKFKNICRTIKENNEENTTL